MEDARTEQPSAQKLARAQREGRMPSSPELGLAAGLFACAFGLRWFGPRLGEALRGLLREALASPRAPELRGWALLAPALLRCVPPLCALLLAIALAGFAAGFFQVGPRFVPAALASGGPRFDPVARLRELFSPERALELLFALLKLATQLGVALWLLASVSRGVFGLALGPTQAAFDALLRVLAALLERCAWAALLLGVLELVYLRLRRLLALRMSRRELLEEQRESHGLPEVRARRQRLIAEARAQAELAALAQADVLLMDGAGRALGFGFERAKRDEQAPRVVAKAHAELAPRLRAEAVRCGIPVRFEPALVGALFRLELTESAPRAHHAALAEVYRRLDRGTP